MQLSNLEKANIKNLTDCVIDSLEAMNDCYKESSKYYDWNDSYEECVINAGQHFAMAKISLKELNKYLGVDNDLDNV